MLNLRVMGESIFLIPNGKKVFLYLRQTFIKTLIFWHFDLESHIQIKTDVLGYVIGRVFN